MYTGPPPTTETDDGRYIHAYPKIAYPHQQLPSLLDGDDATIVVQEKLDGGNTRLALYPDGTRVYGSKKNLHGTTPDDVPAFFTRVAEYLHDTITPELQQTLTDEHGAITLFFENMMYHSLDYDWDDVPPAFLLDAYPHATDTFVDIDELDRIAAALSLTTTPITDKLSLTELDGYFTTTDDGDVEFTDYPIPESQYRDGPAEGVVFKNYTTQTFAKYVSDEFKEANTARWGDTLKDPETGEGLAAVDYTRYISAKYCTDTRIEKHIRKLIMEGHTLELALIPDLSDAVYHDIWNEHGTEFITSGKTIRTDDLQQRVLERCKARLKAIIRNKELLETTTTHEGLDEETYLALRAIGETE